MCWKRAGFSQGNANWLEYDAATSTASFWMQATAGLQQWSSIRRWDV